MTFQASRIAALFIAAAASVAAPAALAASAVQVTIDAGKPGPVINKHVYGQFAEHLGAGIYGGIWVGPGSKVPNIKGWRKDVVGALRDLQVPLVRWPGGCFADEYHWKDGIGPRARRPVKVNTNWGGVEESNAVGTHEFFDLAEMIGADTYVNGNLGSGTVQEMSEWIEYMTSDSKSSLAQLRRKHGRNKPFKVDYFAIGNEAWGCGGNMTPEYYASLYKNYETLLKAPKEQRPRMIASGGNDHDTTWTEVLSKSVKKQTAGISFHYYTIPTGTWKVKGAATGFDEPQWISTLANTLKIDGMIKNNIAVLDKNDPEQTLGLFVDEWGTWYDVEPGTKAGFLFQQNTLRDAVVAALNFNIFHAHAQRVTMSNIAQMVNVLQAMILTEKDKMLLTPTYYAFQMYVPFQDATSLPVDIKDNAAYTLGEASIPGISASAARARDGKLYLALVNTNPKEGADVTIAVAGKAGAGAPAGASGRVLTNAAMDAHNTFKNPQAIKPAPIAATAVNGKLTLAIPAKSVVVVAIADAGS